MSGETVNLNVWASPFKKQDYIRIFENMKEKYSEAIKSLFPPSPDAQKIYYKKVMDEINRTVVWTEDTDPADIFEDVGEKAYELFAADELMKHNLHLSLLSTMYQIFEQQLRGLLYSELKKKFNGVDPGELKNFGTDMGKIKLLYKQCAGYDLKKDEHWNRIEELSLVSNTFKHGAGRASEKLRENYPEVFELGYDHTPVMDYTYTTNSEITFNLKALNFNDFADTLISFWRKIPEHLNGSYTFYDEKQPKKKRR